MLKIAFPKNTIFVFFLQFHEFCSFFVIFHVFCFQNPLVVSIFLIFRFPGKRTIANGEEDKGHSRPDAECQYRDAGNVRRRRRARRSDDSSIR